MKEINPTDILQSFRSDLPNDSKTALAIDTGAGIEEISACATAEGLHALAGTLFELLEEGGLQGNDGAITSGTPVLDVLEDRIREFRKQLPGNSKTAAKIDQRASLEEISECAEEEGLFSFAAMLAEAEQEESRSKP